MSAPDAIDPEIRAARAAQAAAATPFDITTLPIAEGRELSNAAALFFNDGTPEVATVETIAIDGPASTLRARIFKPGATERALLYLHGGGWVTCNVDTHDSVMRRLSLAANAIVVGVDFRLAPEHPFPAPLDDAIAAWRWLVANAAALGVPDTKLGVAGDSGGASLALALAIAERDAGRPYPHASALFYGAFAPQFDTPSHARNGGGAYGLTTERMRWYWRQYVPGALDSAPPLAAPLRANLAGLRAHHLSLADLDVIADDTRLLHEKFAAVGIPSELEEWKGAVHGFIQMGRDVALARQAIAKAGDFLKRRL
ncbi:alpha/beta hydrolase [Terricaulis silvestris]|nr:alpha/beta hydrolase [Terricaulis silvestris]